MTTKNKYIRSWNNYFFVLSGTVMTGLFSQRGNIPLILIGIICSFVVLSVLTYRFRFIEHILDRLHKKQILFSIVFTTVTVIYYTTSFYDVFSSHLDQFSFLRISAQFSNTAGILIAAVIGCLSFYAIFILFCWCYQKYIPIAQKFMLNLSSAEKKCILFSTIILSICVIIIFSMTNVFYSPTANNTIIDFDVVYTADSGNLIADNAYMNINASQNDIRQILFGLFSMPFAICAMVLSKIFFFIPHAYPIFIAIIQIILLQFTILLLSRMLDIGSTQKILFYILLNVTYPTLLFSLNMEQYIFSIFWLILFIYSVYRGNDSEDYFIAATGSLLTSGILFPLLDKSAKKIGNILMAGVKFALLLIVFGRLPRIFSSSNYITKIMEFTGIDLSFKDKLLQYINFVASCFVKPDTAITSSQSYPTFQLAPVKTVQYIGLIVLVIALLGFVLNRRHRFAQICLGWIAYSFIILCMVGWGTKENGLILYTLYFSWAFISLAYLAFIKVLRGKKIAKYILMAIIIALFLINITGIYDVVRFGIQYYPVGV